nr:hypothetical protein [Micromonospora sp. DSM 115978]
MAVETLGLPDPVSVDVVDEGQDYDLAVGWYASTGGFVSGVEWFPPTNAPTVATAARLWRQPDPEDPEDTGLLYSQPFTPTLGARQQIPFGDLVYVPSGRYWCSVYTDRFTLSFNWDGWPATSASLTTDNPDGWLNEGPGFPASGPVASLYHVSPIFEPAAVQAAAALTGSAALTAAGRTIRTASAGMQGAGQVSAVGRAVRRAAAGLIGTGSLSASAVVPPPPRGTAGLGVRAAAAAVAAARGAPTASRGER